MSSVPSPPESGGRSRGLRWNAWNLLLLVPLLMLVTPWFNHDGPRLIGLPFFYWTQLLFVVVGVACVWIVHAMTRRDPLHHAELPDRLSVDQLDESGTTSVQTDTSAEDPGTPETGDDTPGGRR